MLGFMVPVILSLAASAQAHQRDFRQSAASAAQIRFAVESKYDDTGPGAKQPQYAYNTYKNLDEALIAFLDDPDTKLPEQDRNRAVQKLVQPGQTHGGIERFYPKTVEEYTGFKKQKPQEYKYTQPQQKPEYAYRPPKPPLVLTKLKDQFVPYYQGSVLQELERDTLSEPFRLQQVQAVRGNPLSLAHYSRDTDLGDQYNPRPKYSFSYGVNGPETGDHKSAHETREGGVVRGYYSFLDADGAQRTVRYTADDQLGFQATVDRRPLTTS